MTAKLNWYPRAYPIAQLLQLLDPCKSRWSPHGAKRNAEEIGGMMFTNTTQGVGDVLPESERSKGGGKQETRQITSIFRMSSYLLKRALYILN